MIIELHLYVYLRDIKPWFKFKFFQCISKTFPVTVSAMKSQATKCIRQIFRNKLCNFELLYIYWIEHFQLGSWPWKQLVFNASTFDDEQEPWAFSPALVTTYHVPIVMLEVAYTACDTVVNHGSIRDDRHNRWRCARCTTDLSCGDNLSCCLNVLNVNVPINPRWWRRRRRRRGGWWRRPIVVVL